MKKETKELIIFLIVCIGIILAIAIPNIIERNKIKDSFGKIGEAAYNFKKRIDNADSFSDEDIYNNDTNKVDYESDMITLDMFDKIEKGMSQEEVILILGIYDNKKDGENSYMLEWGNSYSTVKDGYWIQIIFDKNDKVLNKYQMGLK